MSNKVVFFNFDFFHSFFIVVCSYLALGSCSDQRGGPRHLLLPRAREVPIQRVPSQPPAPRVTGQFSGYMSERASEYYFCCFRTCLCLLCVVLGPGVWRCAPRWRRCPGSRTRDAKSPPACLPEFNLIVPIERMTLRSLARRTELLFLSSSPS